MAEKRKAISKKLRFEVFKRDSFTCQYCGQMAPDVILEVDHINPVKNKGTNDILNLITSCKDCNRGKGARKLTESDALKKQQEQLKELNEKREQLDLMIQWKKELSNFENDQVDKLEDLFNQHSGACFSDYYKEECKKLIKKYGFAFVYESLEMAINQYLTNDGESKEKTLSYMPRICAARKKDEGNPNLKRIYYIRGILKNRGFYINNATLLSVLTQAIEFEEDFKIVKDIACNARNWTDFMSQLYEIYNFEVD